MTNTSPTLNSAALAEKLADYGIDIADAMERMLDNTELYKKLHTLKGASGNLSFGTLHKLATQICDALSSGDAETAHELMDPLGKAHLQVCKGLMFWQNTAD